MKFIINEDTQNTYYNCESVIAVGEVKSKASIQEFEDCFKKIKRLRNLKRITSGNSFRKYNSSNGILGSDDQKYNQNTNTFDQIFTFIICQEFDTTIESLVYKARTIFSNKQEWFNNIITINKKYIGYVKKIDGNDILSLSALESEELICKNDFEFSFNLLISNILLFIEYGRTVNINYQEYIVDKSYNEKYSCYKIF